MNVYRIQRCIWINRNYLIDYCSVVNEKEWIDMDYKYNWNDSFNGKKLNK
jgi:hypothetical protein